MSSWITVSWLIVLVPYSGNTGIGLVSAEWLVKAGATVYIACRSEERAQGAIKKLNELVPDAASKVKFLPFDLTDLGSAERAAEAFNKQESRLDIFLGNAGIMAWPYEIKNGLEIQMVGTRICSPCSGLELIHAHSLLHAVEPPWPLCFGSSLASHDQRNRQET